MMPLQLEDKPLLVMGAGPKAAALASKSNVLRTLGHKCPPVWVLDHNGLAANWRGFYKRCSAARYAARKGCRLGDDADPIVVVGGGETAASIVSYLIDRFGTKRIPILVLTRSGTIFSRGEGYYENRIFTEYATWGTLPADVRREVIERGDRGVFSVDTIKKLAYANNIDHRFMTVKTVAVSQNDHNTITVNGVLNAQLLVLALGFDPASFLKFMPANIKETLGSNASTNIEEIVGTDLSVEETTLTAKLYLPMMSAFAQGPGFPNLSCLGTLSDRILGRPTRSGLT